MNGNKYENIKLSIDSSNSYLRALNVEQKMQKQTNKQNRNI